MIKNKDISFVLQGIVNPSTNIVIKSIRDHFPESTIILSSWSNSEIGILDYDILVTSDDPGGMIVDTKHNFGDGIILRNSGVSTKSIDIGQNVWIGAKSLILPGVNISDNVIIAGSSVVNRNCEKNSIYAGNPARKIKEF